MRIVRLRGCTFAEAAASSKEELRIASLLERMGWSDETEVLCKCASLLFQIVTSKVRKWEEFLPEKYKGAATFLDESEKVDDQQIIKQLEAGIRSVKSL